MGTRHGFASRLEVPSPLVVLVIHLGPMIRIFSPDDPASNIEAGSFLSGLSDRHVLVESTGPMRCSRSISRRWEHASCSISRCMHVRTARYACMISFAVRRPYSKRTWMRPQVGRNDSQLWSGFSCDKCYVRNRSRPGSPGVFVNRFALADVHRSA